MQRICLSWFFAAAVLIPGMLSAAEHLPGTALLEFPDGTTPADIVPLQLKQVNDYFLRRIAEARETRQARWKPDFASPEAYEKSVACHRAGFREMLGLVPSNTNVAGAGTEEISRADSCRIERITIPMSVGLSARGLLFSCKRGAPHPVVIVCPNAKTWPERLAGLSGDARPPKWLGELLARGAMVYLAQSVERLADHPFCKTNSGYDRRLLLYRLGYVVGRTMPGLDVQDTTAAIDYLAKRPDVDPGRISVVGVGQGGMTALYAGAVDRRVGTTVVADYFQVRDGSWQEPPDRRLYGQLLEFGDAEIAGLIAPRPLWIVRSAGSPAARAQVAAEVERARSFYKGLKAADRLNLVPVRVAEDALSRSVSIIADQWELPKPRHEPARTTAGVPDERAKTMRDQHFEERIAYLHGLLDATDAKRAEYWKITARPPSDFKQIKATMLDQYRALVGEVKTEFPPLNPRTRLVLVADKYKEYQVMLDITEGVQMYAHLLVPRRIKGRTAAVIAQHGFGGTPDMITGFRMTKDTPYHEFGRELAENGYVVFAPTIMHRIPSRLVNDQVRKAASVGMMRLAMVVAKTERTIDFLETLPMVNPERIGYYGLSYGGYSAIWSGPLVDRLAAIVCSGNFNYWRSKITDVHRTSYLRHPDDDFYNWNILNRFSHVELIAMTCPRPFCIEFGQRDGITTPEWTARAWKQVVAVRDHLGLQDQIVLAHYDGVHENHAVEAVDFLDRMLRPERTVGRDYRDPLSAAEPAKHAGGRDSGKTPLITHLLDANAKSRIHGRFWIPTGAKEFCGMAVKVSRMGRPGPIEIRFASAPGKNDRGLGRLTADAVPPKHATLCKVTIKPQPVHGGELIYYDIRCTGNAAAAGHYVIYGPRPIGGREMPGRFALAYRVLTDRPQDALHPSR